MRDKIAKYLKKKYGTEPECLWKRYPRFDVFRHEDNRKWYAAIMEYMLCGDQGGFLIV